MNDYIIEKALDEIDYDIKIDSSIYYNKEGNIVPRVTSILSDTIHEQYLLVWANKLGLKNKKYQEELSKAAVYGTKTHNSIEKFLKGEKINEPNIGFESFMIWWTLLNKNNKVETVFIEKKLTCKYFGGTCDLLLSINDKLFLIDFKTSNFTSYKYFMQLAAYRYMLYHEEGINIDGCLILQLNKFSPSYNELLLDFNNVDHYNFIEVCTKGFLSLVYAYYNTLNVNQLYKNIFL